MHKMDISTERKVVIVVIALFLHLVLVSTHVVLENKRTLFQTAIGVVISPFQIAFQKTVDFISNQFQRYIFLHGSEKRNQELTEQITQLKLDINRLKVQVHDLEFLAHVRKQNIKYHNPIKVDVISIDRNAPLSSLIINKGYDSGIKKDMIVLNGDGELVGKIVEPITPFTAKVRLITSSNGGVGAYLEKNLLEGFIIGSNTSVCIFKYLIESKFVGVGDRVVTSGTDQIFPPYIPIGIVTATEKELLTQKVIVKPFFIEKSIKQLLVAENFQEISFTAIPERPSSSEEHR